MIEKPFKQRNEKSREPASDRQVANWTNYEEPDWYTVTQEDELPAEEPAPG
jgi:actin-related protein